VNQGRWANVKKVKRWKGGLYKRPPETNCRKKSGRSQARVSRKGEDREGGPARGRLRMKKTLGEYFRSREGTNSSWEPCPGVKTKQEEEF